MSIYLVVLKTDPTQIKDLTLRCETLKLPEENVGSALQGRGVGKGSICPRIKTLEKKKKRVSWVKRKPTE